MVTSFFVESEFEPIERDFQPFNLPFPDLFVPILLIQVLIPF